MFPSWLTRLVLAMALAAFPLQGLAETVHLFLCQQSGVHHAAGSGGHGVHHQDGEARHAHAVGTFTGHHHGEGAGRHHDGAPHTSAVAQASDGVAGDAHAAHSCCDVVAAALPSQPLPVARFDFTALAAARDVFHETTFLERPQRPPLR